VEIETFKFRPKTYPDTILPVDSSALSRKRPAIPTMLEPHSKRPCTIKLLDDNSNKAALLNTA
jgi:hypothetical protein